MQPPGGASGSGDGPPPPPSRRRLHFSLGTSQVPEPKKKSLLEGLRSAALLPPPPSHNPSPAPEASTAASTAPPSSGPSVPHTQPHAPTPPPQQLQQPPQQPPGARRSLLSTLTRAGFGPSTSQAFSQEQPGSGPRSEPHSKRPCNTAQPPASHLPSRPSPEPQPQLRPEHPSSAVQGSFPPPRPGTQHPTAVPSAATSAAATSAAATSAGATSAGDAAPPAVTHTASSGQQPSRPPPTNIHTHPGTGQASTSHTSFQHPGVRQASVDHTPLDPLPSSAVAAPAPARAGGSLALSSLWELLSTGTGEAGTAAGAAAGQGGVCDAGAAGEGAPEASSAVVTAPHSPEAAGLQPPGGLSCDLARTAAFATPAAAPAATERMAAAVSTAAMASGSTAMAQPRPTREPSATEVESRENHGAAMPGPDLTLTRPGNSPATGLPVPVQAGPEPDPGDRLQSGSVRAAGMPSYKLRLMGMAAPPAPPPPLHPLESCSGFQGTRGSGDSGFGAGASGGMAACDRGSSPLRGRGGGTGTERGSADGGQGGEGGGAEGGGGGGGGGGRQGRFSEGGGGRGAGGQHDPSVSSADLAALQAAHPPPLRGQGLPSRGEPLVLSMPGSGFTLEVPASINRYLRTYQREGIQFLFEQYSHGKGGILADDMGLGKTVQSIAFMSAVLAKQGSEGDLTAEPRAAPLDTAPAPATTPGGSVAAPVPALGCATPTPTTGQGGGAPALASDAGGIPAPDASTHTLTSPLAAAAPALQPCPAAGTPAPARVHSAPGAGTFSPAAERLPLLVVCPTSVVGNWQRELAMWGSFRSAVLRGKDQVLQAVCTAARNRQLEVVICTYDVMRIHIDALCQVPWHLAIFDECHKLKSATKQVYRAALRLRESGRGTWGGAVPPASPSERARKLPPWAAANAARSRGVLFYGLSGTCMQNEFKELWALIDLFCPGSLGSWSDFDKNFALPMKMGRRVGASPTERKHAERCRKKFERLRERVLLRRTKEIISDQLPKKSDSVVLCALTPLQDRCYKRILSSPEVQLLAQPQWTCPCGSAMPRALCCYSAARPPAMEESVLWRQLHACNCGNAYHPLTNPKGCKRHKPKGCSEAGARWGVRLKPCPACLVLPVLTLLRKVSNHLDLIKARPRDHYEGVGNQEVHLGGSRQGVASRAMERDLELARLVLGPDEMEAGGCVLSHNMSSMADSTHCAKMQVLQTLLHQWFRDGSKVLIFSFCTRVLDCIEHMMLRSRYVTERLDGSTPQQKRQAKVEAFNNSPGIFAFLVSTTAGGMGLNLTAANRVVIFDPSWNPAHDLQAQDRAFRLGQVRDVHVYRLLGAGTLEELIYSRQLYKQQQSNFAVQGNRERRYFEGVQGGGPQLHGELFGLENLLSYTGSKDKLVGIVGQGNARHPGAAAEGTNGELGCDGGGGGEAGNATVCGVEFDIQPFEFEFEAEGSSAKAGGPGCEGKAGAGLGPRGGLSHLLEDLLPLEQCDRLMTDEAVGELLGVVEEGEADKGGGGVGGRLGRRGGHSDAGSDGDEGGEERGGLEEAEERRAGAAGGASGRGLKRPSGGGSSRGVGAHGGTRVAGGAVASSVLARPSPSNVVSVDTLLPQDPAMIRHVLQHEQLLGPSSQELSSGSDTETVRLRDRAKRLKRGPGPERASAHQATKRAIGGMPSLPLVAASPDGRGSGTGPQPGGAGGPPKRRATSLQWAPQRAGPGEGKGAASVPHPQNLQGGAGVSVPAHGPIGGRLGGAGTGDQQAGTGPARVDGAGPSVYDLSTDEEEEGVEEEDMIEDGDAAPGLGALPAAPTPGQHAGRSQEVRSSVRSDLGAGVKKVHTRVGALERVEEVETEEEEEEEGEEDAIEQSGSSGGEGGGSPTRQGGVHVKETKRRTGPTSLAKGPPRQFQPQPLLPPQLQPQLQPRLQHLAQAGPHPPSPLGVLASRPGAPRPSAPLPDVVDVEAHALLLQLAQLRGTSVERTAQDLIDMPASDRARLVARVPPH